MSRVSPDPVPGIPEGSAAYYAHLFTPPERRPALTALFALHREFEELSARQGEPALTQVKLQWWDDEVRRLAAGEPRHPVTTALAGEPSMRGSRDLLREMVGCTGALAGALRESAFDRAVELECRRAAALLGAVARMLIDDEAADGEILLPARNIGAGGRLVTLLRQEAALRASGDQLVPEARAGLDEGLNTIPPGRRPGLGPVLVFGQVNRLRLSRLGRPADPESRLAGAFATLREVMTAWQTARRAAKAIAPAPVRESSHAT